MYRPKTLDEVVGQTSAKKLCKIVVGAYNSNQIKIPHIIFSGPAGYGKTTVGRAMAQEIDKKFYDTNAVTLSSVEKIKAYVSNLREDDILFIDEIHGLPTKVMEWMYTVLEDFEYADDESLQRIKVPNFTCIGATTKLGSLTKPMRDRFHHTVRFTEYTQEELELIVRRVLQSRGMNLASNKPASFIAKVSRGVPRLVKNNTMWLYTYMVQHNKSLSMDQMKEVMMLKGIDENGFTSDDLDYLEVVKKHGPIGLKSICSKLGQSEETVVNEIEPFLIKKNLINITKRGRNYNE